MGEGGGACLPHLGPLEELLQHAAPRALLRARLCISCKGKEQASERRGGDEEAEGGERGTLTYDAQPRSWGRTAGSSRMAMLVWLPADLNTSATSGGADGSAEVEPRTESIRV